MNQFISDIISQSIEVKRDLLAGPETVARIETAATACIRAFQGGKKVLFAGNGGSAADAQHLAAELSGRFYFDREPLYAEALHVNTSYLTAVANDYSFDQVFSRLVQAQGVAGDILVLLSTSGNSPNILHACEAAKKKGMTLIGLTGRSGGKMKEYCDIVITVPSDVTPRIQECHILIGHILCEIIESRLFSGR